METLKYAIVNGNGLHQIRLNGNEEGLVVMQATEKAVLLHIKLLEDLVAEGRAFEGFSQKSIL